MSLKRFKLRFRARFRAYLRRIERRFRLVMSDLKQFKPRFRECLRWDERRFRLVMSDLKRFVEETPWCQLPFLSVEWLIKLPFRLVRRLMCAVPLLSALTAAVIAYVIWPLPPEFWSWCYWCEVLEWWGGMADPHESLRNLGLMLAGFVGIGLATWRSMVASKQAKTAEQGHITDRYSKAVEQLGHKRVSVRIGGLYALKRIAEDSPEQDHLAVMDVLTNFIRHPPYSKKQQEAEAEAELKAGTEPKPIDCPDVEAAIVIVQNRTAQQKAIEKDQGYIFSLARAHWNLLRLLSDLTGVDLRFSDLTGADLTLANLMGANLAAADLMGADLTHANLAGANLTVADLTHANLRSANLTDAKLTDAKLRGADLTGANLSNANLTGAKNLTQDQVDSIDFDPIPPPTLPEGLTLLDPLDTE